MKLIAGLLAGTIHRAVPVSAGGKLAARTTFGIAIRSTTAAQSIFSSLIVAQTPEREVAPSGSIFFSSTVCSIDSGFYGGKSLNYGAQSKSVDCNVGDCLGNGGLSTTAFEDGANSPLFSLPASLGLAAAISGAIGYGDP